MLQFQRLSPSMGLPSPSKQGFSKGASRVSIFLKTEQDRPLSRGKTSRQHPGRAAKLRGGWKAGLVRDRRELLAHALPDGDPP